MKERLVVKSRDPVLYQKAAWNGINQSGWNPVGDRVIIKPDAAQSKVGGVEIPEDVQERMSMAAEAGILVAVGEGAFIWNSDRVSPFAGRKPAPGDRVHIHRFSGQIVIGVDGFKYRIMDSQEVGAVAREEK